MLFVVRCVLWVAVLVPDVRSSQLFAVYCLRFDVCSLLSIACFCRLKCVVLLFVVCGLLLSLTFLLVAGRFLLL